MGRGLKLVQELLGYFHVANHQTLIDNLKMPPY